MAKKISVVHDEDGNPIRIDETDETGSSTKSYRYDGSFLSELWDRKGDVIGEAEHRGDGTTRWEPRTQSEPFNAEPADTSCSTESSVADDECLGSASTYDDSYSFHNSTSNQPSTADSGGSGWLIVAIVIVVGAFFSYRTDLSQNGESATQDSAAFVRSTVSSQLEDIEQSTETPLGRASIEGNVEAVRQLIRNGANVNDGFGYKLSATPLLEAARAGHLAVVEELVRAGSRLDVSGDGDGLTPLGAAASRGHVDVVQYLIGVGSQLTGGDNDYDPEPPLHAAVRGGHLEIVGMLIYAGANPDTPFRSSSAREIAATAGREDILAVFGLDTGNWEVAEFSAAEPPPDSIATRLAVSISTPVIDLTGNWQSGGACIDLAHKPAAKTLSLNTYYCESEEKAEYRMTSLTSAGWRDETGNLVVTATGSADTIVVMAKSPLVTSKGDTLHVLSNWLHDRPKRFVRLPN